MSLSRIAKMSGVSISTVSRAINNDPRISEDTTERIKKAMDETGYIPKSQQYKSWRGNSSNKGIRTGNVALVEIGDHTYQSSLVCDILHGATLRLAEHGMNMIAAYVENDAMPPCLAHRQVDGIIVRGTPTGKVADRMLEFPCVWLTSQHTSSGDYVIGGHDTGGRLAARYFLERGHRRLAFLNI